MKLSTMRHIDYWVGVPACYLVSLWIKLRDAVVPRPRDHKGRVLFIELSEMGSTILAAPAIQRAIHRSARLSGKEPCFVIFEKNVQSLKLLGLFKEENICTIRESSIPSMLADIVRFMRFCREREVDTTIDLELYARISSILAMISGARTRVGFDNYLGEGLHRGSHLTHRVNYSTYYHMSQNFMALVEALEGDGTEVPCPKQYVPVPEPAVCAPRTEESYEHVRQQLAARIELDGDARVVVLNHDAGKLLPIRTWPVERWARLAKELIEADHRTVVLLMGIPDCAESARTIEAEVNHPRLVNFVGCTRHLTDVINLFHQAELLITNDSGPAHFATLTDIASISLFGPETPRMYGPLGERRVNVYKELACSPCLTAANHRNSPCQDNVCLQQITVEEVRDHALRLLSEQSSVPAG